MLTLKLKQAECALADGRLDEAYEVLSDDSVRQHRKGQHLAGRLARALVERGQQHLAASRIQQALADCNKADKIGGNLAEVAQLRAAACDTLNQQHFAQQQQEQKLAQAQRYMRAGELSAAQQVMAAVEHGRAELLADEAAARRVEIETALAAIQAALEDQDLERALDGWASLAGRISTTNAKVSQLLNRIKTTACSTIRSHLTSGRVDRAQGLAERLEAVGMASSETQEFHDVLGYCREAAQAIESRCPEKAACVLAKLQLLLPDAPWVTQMAEQARLADEHLKRLAIGPLGLLKMKSIPDTPLPTPAVPSPASSPTPSSRPPAIPSTPVPSAPEAPVVLQIDGVGSFLILTQNPLTVGPISGRLRPHLGLLTDPGLPAVTLERQDADYLIEASAPVKVNQALVTKRLLADGDRIALSDRCRLKFNQPNAASNTATLSLSGARLARPDINYCILMDRDLLIGDQSSHHIRVPHLERPVTLLRQNGHLICRAAAPAMAKGRPLTMSQGLPLDVPITVGDLSLVLTPYTS